MSVLENVVGKKHCS